jgi:hypothetical protein
MLHKMVPRSRTCRVDDGLRRVRVSITAHKPATCRDLCLSRPRHRDRHANTVDG